MKSKREFSRSWGKLFLLFIALSVVLIAPVIGFLSTVDGWLIFGKGQYLSHSHGPVYKLGLVNSFTLFVAPEHPTDRDIVKAAILAAVAVVSLTFGVVLSRMKKGSVLGPGRFFTYVFFVMSFLAANEILGIHGTLGRNLRFLGQLRFIDQPVNGIVVLAGALAVVFLMRYRRTILASRGAFALMGIALGFFIAGALNDASGLPAAQVPGLLGPVCGIASLIVLGISQLRTAMLDLRPAPPAPSFKLFCYEGGDVGAISFATSLSITAGKPR